MALSVAEGIHGTFHYHWSPDSGRSSLCGANVMPTMVTPASWGYVGHLRERYCRKCEALKAQNE